jgi:hypothetical protein
MDTNARDVLGDEKNVEMEAGRDETGCMRVELRARTC